MVKILVINPGSTTTKLAIYEDEKEVISENLNHSNEELAPFGTKITDQYEFRRDIIKDFLTKHDIDLNSISAVIGRGGLSKPIPGGVHLVNEALCKDLYEGYLGQHASNLGGLIADALAKEIGNNVPAFIADPVVVDEMEDIARLSGLPELPRISIFHALNHKACAKRYANEIGKNYEDINLIVVHLGGGISIAAHQKGKVIDVNNALDGEGPYSPERSGTLPVGGLIKLCYSGKYSLDELRKLNKGSGGLVAYQGTNNAKAVCEKGLAGDRKAWLAFFGMAYQVAKEIGANAAVLKGKVDAIILTGGVAYNKSFCEFVEERVSFIAPVVVYPGENEMQALALAAYRVLTSQEKIQHYE
ncbi:MAG: butyrate kinase [Candidatus Coatesbacteria bacterium]|nr:butyrate kinase [Candidatus Coatesbacteria bacterium]